MNLFELVAKLSLDTSDYDKGIHGSREKADDLSAGLKKASESSETAANKIKYVSEKYKAASENVKKLTEEFNKSVQVNGATSKETEKLAEKLGKAEREAAKFENELHRLAGTTENTNVKMGSFAQTLGSGLKKAAAIGMKALAGIATGVSALGTMAVRQFAEYEQLVGGVDTLFKGSADTVKQYASQAYATVGLSANQYMEQVTSFSASLVQSLAGNSQEATSVSVEALEQQLEAVQENNEKRLDAMEEAHDKEIEDYQALTDEKIALIDEQYKESIKLIDEEKYNQLKAIDEQIAALNGQTEAEQNALKRKEQEERKSELQSRIYNAKSYADREKAQADYNNYIERLAQRERQERRKAQIDELKVEKENIKKIADEKKQAEKEKRDGAVKAIRDEAAIRLKEIKKAHKRELDELKKHNKQALAEIKKQQQAIASASSGMAQVTEETYAKAAEYSNLAIKDMADNAAKMGTSMGMIQNAYNGFAKGNFMMLDNLKLGFGGTKGEMERLLEQAEQLTGKDFDISSYADIIEAIHAIQENMGISGVAAEEAKTTITGSLGMLKASFNNLLVGISDDEADFGKLMDEFVQSAGYAGKNIVPRIEQSLVGIGKFISKLAPVVAEAIPGLVQNVLPTAISAAGDLLKAIIGGLEATIKTLPEIASAALDLLVELGNAISEALPTLIPTIVNVVLDIVDTIIEHADELLNAATAIIQALSDGFLEALPQYIDKMPELIKKMIEFVSDNVPKIMEVGIDILFAIAKGMAENFPIIVSKIPEMFKAIAEGAYNYGYKMFDVGKKLIEKIKEGAVSIFNKLYNLGGKIADKVINGVHDAIEKIKAVGSWLIEKIKEGFNNTVDGLRTLGKNVVDKIKTGISDAWQGLTKWFENLWDGLFGEKNMKINVETNGNGVDGSHRNGLAFVPKDDYIARLHKGERVLTAEENKAYTNGGGMNLTQNIYAAQQTPVEIEAAAYQTFMQARWAF